MISIICSTKKPNEDYKKHILETCGVINSEFLFYKNENEYSLTDVYNKGLKESKYDIVVFLHDDIIIKTNNWGNKLLKHYKRNVEYGILGVAGSKSLPTSGKWWENKKTMYGQVYHTDKGNTWLSKYSDDLGNKITDVVVVDGVFFSVNKKVIKKEFNADIKGFHFYDIDFCFNNYINDIKVGVHYDIKINHMSIGITNNEWEENRKQFSDTYKDSLPIKIKEEFKDTKLKLLIGLLNFSNLTGSELSTLETAKALSKFNIDITIISKAVSEKFKLVCKQNNIKTCTFEEPPGYKRGDGKWGFNSPEGFKPSQEGVLYRIDETTFDVIHANHKPITESLLNLYPECNFVNIVRSEVIDLENPIISDKIKKYIAIRPSIKDYLIKEFKIDSDKIDVVYNAFDKNRFKPNKMIKNTDKKVILFVGTMDYLRKQSIDDLIDECNDNGDELWLVGKDFMGYGKQYSEKYEFVKYYNETDKIEDFYNMCDETAGVLLGRTTIEGFLCGKPGWVYTIDKNGIVLTKEFMEVPNDLSIFDIETHKNKMFDIYKEVFNK